LLHHLLSLLEALLALLRPRFDLFLWRRPRAHGGRWARSRWCGDARLIVSCHGRPLRRRGTMDLGPRCCNARHGRSLRRGDMRRRVRGHRGTLWWSRMERGSSRSCHRRRRRRTGHCGRRCCARRRSCRSGCWGSAATWPVTFSRFGRRTGAHRDRGDTEKKRGKAHTARKHDRNSLVLRCPEWQRASAGIVRDFAMQDWRNSSQP